MRILIVDDEPASREVVRQAVLKLGHDCLVASSGEVAWETFQHAPIDVVVSDWSMPGMDGLQLCNRVRGFAKDTYTYFILLTMHGDDPRKLREAMQAGVDDFLPKPLDPKQLALRFLVATRVANLCQREAQTKERVSFLEEQVRNRSSFQEMIGKSPLMQDVYQRVRLAAQSPVSVLIHGESGTGKELAARAIHALSLRARRPLITVNCGALPDNLLESELFGHVRGAFTGAIRPKQGIFQLAHEGTLLLDEVGDVSPQLQVKLLRAVQEQEIRPVGGEETIKIDVRVIAATNKDLRELVDSGDFREDLYYRLRVFQVDLPALRDRREDIPLLVDHFISEFAAQLDKNVQGVAPEAFRALLDHSWPGNVRELRNAIEHAFVVVTGDRICADDLPREIPSDLAGSAANGGNGSHDNGKNGDLTVRSLEIIEALRECNGNRTAAASKLGISRVALWKRIRRLGIQSQLPPRS